MKIRIASPKEFYAGLIFAGIGVVALVVARNYSLGTTVRMGPGYFPLLLSLVLVFLGLASTVRSLKTTGEPIGRWPLVPLFFVVAGVIAFGLLIERTGLIVAVLGLLLLSCYGRLRSQPVEFLIIAAVLTGIAVGVFVYALGMPFSLF